MNHTKRLALILACALPVSLGAADFDGSKPLICAPVEVFECMPGFECLKGGPRESGAPRFIRVDIAKKQVSGPKRMSAIKSIETTDEQIVLQGTELGMGWTMALDRASGDMSITLVDREGAFVFFGSCTVQ